MRGFDICYYHLVHDVCILPSCSCGYTVVFHVFKHLCCRPGTPSLSNDLVCQNIALPALFSIQTSAVLWTLLSGPIQECWQHPLGSCMGSYNNLGTLQAAPWAIQWCWQHFEAACMGHTQTSAALLKQLSGPIHTNTKLGTIPQALGPYNNCSTPHSAHGPIQGCW